MKFEDLSPLEQLYVSIEKFNFDKVKELIETSKTMLAHENSKGLLPAEYAFEKLSAITLPKRAEKDTARLLLTETFEFYHSIKDQDEYTYVILKNILEKHLPILKSITITNTKDYTWKEFQDALESNHLYKVKEFVLHDLRFLTKLSPINQKLAITSVWNKNNKNNEVFEFLIKEYANLLSNAITHQELTLLSRFKYMLSPQILTVLFIRINPASPIKNDEFDIILSNTLKTQGFENLKQFTSARQVLVNAIRKDDYGTTTSLIKQFPSFSTLECLKGEFPCVYASKYVLDDFIGRPTRAAKNVFRFLFNDLIEKRNALQKLGFLDEKQKYLLSKLQNTISDLASKETYTNELFVEAIYTGNFEKVRHFVLMNNSFATRTIEGSYPLEIAEKYKSLFPEIFNYLETFATPVATNFKFFNPKEQPPRMVNYLNDELDHDRLGPQEEVPMPSSFKFK